MPGKNFGIFRWAARRLGMRLADVLVRSRLAGAAYAKGVARSDREDDDKNHDLGNLAQLLTENARTFRRHELDQSLVSIL